MISSNTVATNNKGMNGNILNDEVCRRALKRAHIIVVEEMKPDGVLDGMRKSGFLSQDEYGDLQNVTNKLMKNRIIVSKISQSGKRAYCEFKQCLRDTNQNHLVHELEIKEAELISETASNYPLPDERRNRLNHDSTVYERMETEQQPQPPAPALQRSTFYGLSRDVEVVKKTITKDLHDGRLIELRKAMVRELKSPVVSYTNEKLRGGFGTVYISKEQVPEFKLRVVLKEINVQQQAGNLSQKLGSVTNEKIAARLMHFGIVPLLAYHDDHEHMQYYFVSPYLKEGDLFQAIKKDKGRAKKDIQLKWQTRIKIMYQIACAIDFMHTENKFRGTILHMDITSKNIVLDAKFNARLIDFGLARELKEGDERLLMTTMCVGTPGYFPTVQHNMLTKQHDYHNFGVVLLELITGLDPFATQEAIELRKWHHSLIVAKQQDSIWNAHEVVNQIATIAVKCIESVSPECESPITSEQIKSDLKKMCRKHSAPEWEPIGDGRCEICLVNEEMKVGFDGHDIVSTQPTTCSRRIRTCCSCMRNSFINPIKCHTCGETIEPFINANWGAILVAGYDEEAGQVFKKDIRQFKEVITSKVLPAMCISSNNVIILDVDMNDNNAEREIDKAFNKLFNKDIQTLLFVYSGHNGENGLQVGLNTYYPLNKISEKLKSWKEQKPQFGKVIAFLDCCYPEKLNLNSSLKLIQFNATAPRATANADKKDGSPFLQYVIQAFTASANGKGCKHEKCKCGEYLQGDFITLDVLWKYLNEHIKNGHLSGDEPHLNAENIALKDTILAYNYDFKVQFVFTIQWPGEKETKNISVLPSEFNEFIQLKLKFATDVMKHVYGMSPVSEESLSKFAEIISIEINTGPSTKHIQEIDNEEKLFLAWNSKRLLRCTARLLHNITVGKPVGRCLKDVPNIRTVHEELLRKCMLTELQLTGSDLVKYKDQLIKKNKTTIQFKDYLYVLEMIIHQTKENQLRDNRLDISFVDLPNKYTLVHVSLVQKPGHQDVAQ